MSLDYRQLRDSDYEALAEMFNEAFIADGVPMHQVAEEIREEFESLSVDLAAHTVSAWDGNQLVGVTYSYLMGSDEQHECCYVDGTIRPSHRGLGIGHHLLRSGLVTAERLLSGSQSRAPKFIRVIASESNHTAQRLFERVGLKPVRYFADLHRSLTPLPAVPTAVGFRIVSWDVARNEEVRSVRNIAFRDHWGSSPLSEELWAARTTGFGSRLDLSYLALSDDNAIVGYLLSHRYENDDSLLGATYAWVNNIATLAEWRGRGVATQMLLTAMTAYRAAGVERAAIEVDSDNPTGAYRLYESLGFEPWRQMVMYQCEIGSGQRHQEREHR